MSYSSDRVWSDQYLYLIKTIVGPYLLTEASAEEDNHRATDLIMLAADKIRIACRIRRQGYADRYPDDITIRSHRDSGAKTEFTKIFDDGYANWMFYGHVCPHNRESLVRWMLVDLDGLRWVKQNHPDQWHLTLHQQANKDGTYFSVINVRRLADLTGMDLIIAEADLAVQP